MHFKGAPTVNGTDAFAALQKEGGVSHDLSWSCYLVSWKLGLTQSLYGFGRQIFRHGGGGEITWVLLAIWPGLLLEKSLDCLSPCNVIPFLEPGTMTTCFIDSIRILNLVFTFSLGQPGREGNELKICVILTRLFNTWKERGPRKLKFGLEKFQKNVF